MVGLTICLLSPQSMKKVKVSGFYIYFASLKQDTRKIEVIFLAKVSDYKAARF